MMGISSIQSLRLEQPPSCVAFCPEKPQFCVIGTYLLHKAEAEEADPETGVDVMSDASTSTTQAQSQRRSGTLLVYMLNQDELQLVGSLAVQSAILDIQWSTDYLLCAATSTGSLLFCGLDGVTGEISLLRTFHVADSSVLVLSLCWHPVQKDTLGITLSTGEVCLVFLAREADLGTYERFSVTRLQQHEVEAWTIAFCTAGDRIYSGGDDVTIRCSTWDHHQEVTSLWQDRRIHGAGVTAILPLTRNLLITGSYDDHIRLLDTPPAGRRQVLAEENLGGGVWRLKLITPFSAESTRCIILASCMHAGARILELTETSFGEWSFQVLAKFEEHQSMNYGSDIQPGLGAAQRVLSTSFYDRLLCLWTVDLSSFQSSS